MLRTNMSMQRMTLTVFGLGHLPVAPGTMGSLPPVVLAIVLAMSGASVWAINLCLIVLAVVFASACARFGTEAEQASGEKDPQEIVADEVAGQAIPLLFLPWAVAGEANALMWNLALALTAFITFRAFDIAKPPPVRNVERIGGGPGILLDDVVAGVYALIATQAIVHLILPAVV
jgi:phosphatidylglycerophosphatase A